MCRVPLHSPFRPRFRREAALRRETVPHDLVCRWRHSRLRLLQLRQARRTVAHKRRHGRGSRPRHRRMPGHRIQDPPLPVGCRCRRGEDRGGHSGVRPFTCLRHKPENLTSQSARGIFALGLGAAGVDLGSCPPRIALLPYAFASTEKKRKSLARSARNSWRRAFQSWYQTFHQRLRKTRAIPLRPDPP
jgi:hypothetical protein